MPVPVNPVCPYEAANKQIAKWRRAVCAFLPAAQPPRQLRAFHGAGVILRHEANGCFMQIPLPLGRAPGEHGSRDLNQILCISKKYRHGRPRRLKRRRFRRVPAQ